ncbi:hypothetical protein DEQ92_20975 [Haloferax sp. Atlit-6N]|uniref:hypothetical protein n=1 Tax=Haloferax sp. Atlit-6N TaxID=2077205 RepID=UPI000E254C30|nr:hypothetical protein [Haloferax sp. Atlit-6N]RDZ99086.1 hypothetical protein DEQ92_20975 [Haloferax sp. Atlit-6N]
MVDAVPQEAPTRFDYVLGGMGVSLACGGVGGIVSAVPLAAASGVASVIATLLLLLGTASQY